MKPSLWPGPTPTYRQPIFANRRDLPQASQPVRDLQARLRREHPNIAIFDPFPLLCPPAQQRCSTHQNGQMVFNDGIHLTLFGARSLSSPLTAFLDQI
jgi:hypothetical protein